MNSGRLKECTDLSSEILKNFELSELPVSKTFLNVFVYAVFWAMKMVFCFSHMSLLAIQTLHLECPLIHGEFQK